MAGYYTLFKSEKSGEWYFNLKAGNHETILQSEGYTSRAGAENGIDSVRENGTEAARFDRRESSVPNYWFVLKAGNGQIIGKSEMYPDARSRDKGIESVKTNAPTTEVKDKSEG